MDNKPFANILPFGLCTSLANPITAAQTAAALGVLTPGTCTPGGPRAVDRRARRRRSSAASRADPDVDVHLRYGGVITIINPGATKTVT